MGGTREGGLKAAAKLTAKDPDYFKKLRAKATPVAGSDNPGSFSKDPERARAAGAKGGRISRRRKASPGQQAERAQ